MKPRHRLGALLLDAVADRWPHLWLRHGRPVGARLGQLGEAEVARHLVRAGWGLLARRCSTPFGELDIVARHGTSLVAVEVKTGRVPEGAPRWTPGERLDPATLERQMRAADWLAHRTPGARGSRVDLIEVRLVGDRGRVELHHQRDVRAPQPGLRAERSSGAWMQSAAPGTPAPAIPQQRRSGNV